MANVQKNERKVLYVGITGGKLSISKKADENTPFAQEHFYTDASGNKKSVWKVFLWNIVGFIKDVRITENEGPDGDKFEQLAIGIETDDEYTVLQIDPRSKYAQDFLRRARGIDFTKECFINSYNWEEKNKQGIVIKQDYNPEIGEKNSSKSWIRTIGNYYYNVDEKKWSDEVPKPQGDTSTYEKEDWKIYFLQLNKFYKSTVAKYIQPMLKEAWPVDHAEPKMEKKPGTVEMDEEIEVDDDLPF